jgi:hypothetical protein
MQIYDRKETWMRHISYTPIIFLKNRDRTNRTWLIMTMEIVT